MLEAILLAAGYTVGVYSTPHLQHYNERIRVNGIPVQEALITSSFAQINEARANISLSYFEFGTLAALEIFKHESVDVRILEVGLGGRLDAVNIIDADAALITSIGIDHVDWLGSDISDIAFEKAGIFRASQKAVCGAVDVPLSLVNFAQSLRTDLLCVGPDFNVEINKTSWRLIAHHRFAGEYAFPALVGEHQTYNAASVITLLAHISLELPVKASHIKTGLSHCKLAGRMQIIAAKPHLLLDVAHNPQSARVLADYLKKYHSDKKLCAVFSIMSDKDIAGVLLPLKGLVEKWYIAPISSSRGATTAEIEQNILENGVGESIIYPSIELALSAAQEESNKNDLIVCFGSFYVVEGCLEAL
jgi:dihydrofolate synthase/folylpolyglutamate synthase